MIQRDVLHVATRSMAPIWIVRTPAARLLTPNQIIILMVALQRDPDPMRYQDAYAAVRGERAWTIMNRLRMLGALEHRRYNNWYLTEKGRIAAALARAKDLRLAEAYPA